MKRLLPILLLLGILSCSKSTSSEHLQIGEEIPDFLTYTIDGRNISKSDLLGKPGVIIHFGTTCPDCHVQLPEIETVYRAFGEMANVLAISRGENANTVRQFWQENDYTIPAVATGDKNLYNLFDRDSKTGIPQVYITDSSGIVIAYTDWNKVLRADEILTTIQKLKN